MADEQSKSIEPWLSGAWIIMDDTSPGAILTRLDERTKNLVEDVAEIKRNQAEHYVTRQEFTNLKDKVDLIQKIVFTAIGLVLLTVGGAVMKLVIMPGAGS